MNKYIVSNSEMIDWMSYNKSILFVKFKKNEQDVYLYKEVELELFLKLIEFDLKGISVGKSFNELVKSKVDIYPCEKISMEEYNDNK